LGIVLFGFRDRFLAFFSFFLLLAVVDQTGFSQFSDFLNDVDLVVQKLLILF
jgi:hypothetical protein